jgi:small subunit ribosomal protein S18
MPPSRNPGRSGVRPRRSYRRHYIRRKKVCRFCVEKIHHIDYKDTRLLSAFNPERGKILPRRISGTCAPCQRRLMAALKRARNIALLPFASG